MIVILRVGPCNWQLLLLVLLWPVNSFLGYSMSQHQFFFSTCNHPCFLINARPVVDPQPRDTHGPPKMQGATRREEGV